MIVFIPIENSKRELRGKLNLSSYLIKKGFKVIIGEKKEILRLSNMLKNGIYLDKGYDYRSSEKIYSKLKSNNNLIVNLDEEGGVYLGNFEQLEHRTPQKMIDNVDMIFLWGEKQFEYLTKNRSSYSKHKFHVTGHPKFNIKKEYNFSQEIIINKKNITCLICTNFWSYNHKLGLEFAKNNYSSRFQNFNLFIKHHKISVEKFCHLILKIAKNDKFNIILRPHPEENENFYIKKFLNFSNIKVTKEKSIDYWIKNSDLLIHNDCTTGIEARLLGKPVFTYNCSPYKKVQCDLPILISQEFKSYNDFLLKIEKKDKRLKEDLKNINNFFSIFTNSSEKISKILKEQFFNEIDFQKSKFINSWRILTSHINVTGLKYILKYLLNKESILMKSKIEGINKSKIQFFFYNLKFKHVSIKRVGIRSYYIYKKNNIDFD